METSEQGKMDQAYFTDTHSPGAVLTLEQLDHDNAKFPMDPHDQAAIEALAPGETYVLQHAEEDDNGEAPTWGTITRLAADTTVRALTRDGTVLGMGFDDAAARQDAVERHADPADVNAGEYVDGTLAALSGWGDMLLGPDFVCLAPDGRVRRIDVDDISNEDKGTPNDPGWASDLWRERENDSAEPEPPVSNVAGQGASPAEMGQSGSDEDAAAARCRAAAKRGPYTIRWANDLGNNTPGVHIAEHMTVDTVIAWLSTHEDVGTFEIIDEVDGRPACGLDTGLAGGAAGCECHRCVPVLPTDEPRIRAAGPGGSEPVDG